MFDKDDFLLRADENSEMLADSAMNVIRTALQLSDPNAEVPDPVPVSHRNLRLLIRAAYKAGATFGLAEMLIIAGSGT